jgi:ribosomal-protein-alanine N-acetyltransferase
VSARVPGPPEAGDAVSARVRPLRAGDLPAVLALERVLFPDDPWTPGMFAGELAQPSGTRYYLAAEEAAEEAQEGNAIVGYAGMMLPGGRQAEVLTLAVAPGHWGQGIGSALLAALVDEAGKRDCTEMFLEVRADNARAQALYRRYGFTEVGVRRGYYQPSGTDAIVMRRSLARRARAASAQRAGGGR